ncbi:hypothetical protein ABZ802_30910 [Streptomyces sp. NPDC047737]
MSGAEPSRGKEPVRTKLQRAADAARLAASLLQGVYYALRTGSIWPL